MVNYLHAVINLLLRITESFYMSNLGLSENAALYLGLTTPFPGQNEFHMDGSYINYSIFFFTTILNGVYL